jgi:hypothetical protein
MRRYQLQFFSVFNAMSVHPCFARRLTNSLFALATIDGAAPLAEQATGQLGARARWLSHGIRIGGFHADNNPE